MGLRIATGGLLIVFVVLSMTSDSAPVVASHAGGADSFAVDMNPILTPPNTATSLGSRQTCARIDRNGIQDADEDSVDALTLDITVTNVPASNPMIGFEYHFSYNEVALTVLGYENVSLVAANPGSELYDITAAVPDTEADGRWRGTLLDTSETPPESGTGILQRVTISADAGAASGLYPVVFLNDPNDRWSAHVDPQNDAYIPHTLLGANIAIGTTYCPLTDSDGDKFYDQTEAACGSDVYNPLFRPERTDGVYAGVSDDGDAQIDEPLPAASETADCDGDGFTGRTEKPVFSATTTFDDQRTCWIAWPPDINNDGDVTGADLNAVASVMGQNVPPAPARKNIAPDPPDGFITGADLFAVSSRSGMRCLTSTP